MGIEEQVRSLVSTALAELATAGELPAAVTTAAFSVERPKRAEHGDLATNAPLAIQKLAGRPPRDLAELLADRLRQLPAIRAVDIAGPGFLNFRLDPSLFHRVLGEILDAGPGYGRAPAATGERVLLEFVSANPTGPLLISHGRGAILGDAVGALLEATGHRVTREYYINDFGNQIRLLGASVRAALAGSAPPEGGYAADYVRELGTWIRDNDPAALTDPDPATLSRVAVARMLDGIPGSRTLPGIRRTLAELRIRHDVWFSEESLHRWGRVRAALGQLAQGGHLEERDGALFFKSEAAGDDKDRVVRKQDGATTYFASDIAYHADKLARGYDRLLVVLGADHHGYTARVRGALRALGLPSERFEVLLYQLVNLLRDGKPYKLGKRLGNLITIEEVVEEIDQAAGRPGAGADALRYFYLSRRSDNTIDLDLEVAKKASLDNPVFYLQYGYVRVCSVLRRASARMDLTPPRWTDALAAKLTHPDELAIVARLGRFPAVLAEAAALREPHRILFYLQELSQAFQSYWTRLRGEGDAILPTWTVTAEAGWEARWDRDKTLARLAWVEAIRTVYAAGLRLAGITALERMDRRDPAEQGRGALPPDTPDTPAGTDPAARDDGHNDETDDEDLTETTRNQ
ncbi:arginine--tRNA ligase [Chondromyces apiculatus]|uniref:Arginine--tRNA ligase n=1 Tax=Chondromyces apiculatus DSM 436 TaxID=1192034 RepID=A0A017TEW9_9BACT|nr:arginine--tRNA ligase [Chondromyces apiculatus]EYF07843.1 Arginyl-tRNA synthetase [Chondromyces apiculatus DSM 436]